MAAPCPGLNLRVREGVEKGGAGGREGEGPLILTQNSKMSSLVRARSLLSKLNTHLARSGLGATMAHQLKVERSKPCGQFFPLSKSFQLALNKLLW